MSQKDRKYVDFKVVKDCVSITQILERYDLLKDLRHVNDDQLTGRCPIHKGENSTAFRVSVSKNCWNCFSTCKCGGNILDLVAKMEGVGIREAAFLIAEWLDVTDASPNGDRPKSKQRTKKPESAQQQSTKEAASLLGYHPKTLLKNAAKWRLEKIYMSQTNVCFYQDEIVKLSKSRSYSGRSADS